MASPGRRRVGVCRCGTVSPTLRRKNEEYIIPSRLNSIALAAMSAHVEARSESCHAATEKDSVPSSIAGTAACSMGDPKKVVANYATKSVLIYPDRIRTRRLTPEAKEDYFKHLLENKPRKDHLRTIMIDCNTAIDIGRIHLRFQQRRSGEGPVHLHLQMGWGAVAHHQPSFLGDAERSSRLRSSARMGVKVCAHNLDIAYVMNKHRRDPASPPGGCIRTMPDRCSGPR